MTGSEHPGRATDGKTPTPPSTLLHGPGFVDDDGLAQSRGASGSSPRAPSAEIGNGSGPALLPHGPALLDPEPDAPARVDVGWMPERVEAPRVRVGTGFWIATGSCVLVASWAVLSLASFVTGLLAQSLALGLLAMAAVALGGGMLLYAALLEVRAYRSLGEVERLRTVLAAPGTALDVAQGAAKAWLHRVGPAVPDKAAIERLLVAAGSVAEVRAVLRSQVADRLQKAAAKLGRRAAVDGATLVAVCPHPAWDGLLAGGRGVLVVRHVAALYGLRPGLAVTLALLRRVAWTAAGTAGLSFVSQGVAEQVLSATPVLKHFAGALPGTGTVALRLYRLAGITAEACSPVG